MQDKLRWDSKYASNDMVLESSVLLDLALPFLEKQESKERLKVLDIACGTGRHSLKLMSSRKLNLTCVDISEVALSKLEALLKAKEYSSHKVNLVCADLENFEANEEYDLVMKFFYLNRGILKNLRSLVKQNGIFIYESFERLSEDKNTDHYLDVDELLTYLSDFEILHKDYVNESEEKRTIRVIARRIL
ncbi:class I SAM-dependent methyltransferase [Helicobacter sp. 13S00401-1]|uniref:class I SAM-dependent methyltransferase n=1 Tax=Helicobacter sp. 13S00401-1 TaxID=1905758 RepID=UPI00117AC445|nr:class I SAM-dependent methyltransferase [Helicobacter sp. 13S00401-1]